MWSRTSARRGREAPGVAFAPRRDFGVDVSGGLAWSGPAARALGRGPGPRADQPCGGRVPRARSLGLAVVGSDAGDGARPEPVAAPDSGRAGGGPAWTPCSSAARWRGLRPTTASRARLPGASCAVRRGQCPGRSPMAAWGLPKPLPQMGRMPPRDEASCVPAGSTVHDPDRNYGDIHAH